MEESPEAPLILLHHDGELREVRTLLDSLEIPVHERVGPLRPAESRAAWQSVIGTPKRLLEFKVNVTGPRPTFIAIADQLSKTLESQMKRLRIHYVVNRPVHPMALRLLILHALYNGPERRKRDRVSIGAEVRIRSGVFAKPATLAEISLRGARILTHQPLRTGAPIKLLIGRDLTLSGTLKIPAATVRTCSLEDGCVEVGLRFDEAGPKTTELLRRFIDLHRRGPVQVRHQIAGTVSTPGSTPHVSQTSAATPARANVAATPPPQPTVAPMPIAATVDAAVDPTVEEDERRNAGRHAYDNRVVALLDEAARVFIGRDISVGGMRVDAHPEIGIGCRVKLALHAGPRSEPLLVNAIVQRDDGDEGIFLRFIDESRSLEREIDQVISRIGVSSGEGLDSDVVVSEIIEVAAAAP